MHRPFYIPRPLCEHIGGEAPSERDGIEVMATHAWRDDRAGQSDDNPERLAAMLAELAYGLFAVSTILSICAVKLGVGGLPFRMWTLLAAAGLLVIAAPATVARALRETRSLLLLVVVIAIIGTVVSLIAKTPPAAVARQLVEAHAQALVAVVIGYALMLRFGLPRVLAAILVAFAITALFAAAQAFHVPGAWALRDRVAAMSNDSIFNFTFYDPHQRPMGMSYTPVLFATQTCLALACWFYIRLWRGSWRSRRFDWSIIGVSLLLLALSAITGNRSPLLGIGVFLLVFTIVRHPRLTGLVLPAALLALAALTFSADSLSDTGLRVARTNSSSENRSTLRSYGYFLFQRRPIGYGLSFDSTTKWPLFYQQTIYMPNPDSIRNWALHNYYLNVLTKYGILILFILPWLIPRRREQVILWLGFLPYVIHIFFHNDGPLQGDTLSFYVFAAAALMLKRKELFQEDKPRERPTPWRRAFPSARPTAA